MSSKRLTFPTSEEAIRDLRAGDEHPGERGPLTLPTGELMRKALFFGGETDELEHFGNGALNFSVGST